MDVGNLAEVATIFMGFGSVAALIVAARTLIVAKKSLHLDIVDA